MSKNPNHPPKGSTISVEPIKSLDDINKIKSLLTNSPRDYAIFILGINTNLRASDISTISVEQARTAITLKEIFLREKKTCKTRRISLNQSVLNALISLLNTMPNTENNEPLFQSRKGKTPLTVPYINNLVKNWCRKTHIKGNFGSHTLRKTFGYIQRTIYNAPLPTLMTAFNHSSQWQTLHYLCIQPEEVKALYMNEI